MEIYTLKELQALSIRYVDYAVWQQLSKQRLGKQQQFWLKQLAGDVPPLDLPVVRDRAAVEIHDADVHQLELSEEEGLAIHQFTTSANVSDFMFLLSIYYLLLSKLSGNTDIVIGTDVAGRTNISLAGIVGTFINQLPLRIKLRTDVTYMEFLEDVKTGVLAAFDNQDLQYDQIVALRKERGYSDNLVEVHFSMANYLNKQLPESRLDITPIDLRIKNTTQYEFKLEAVLTGGRLNLLFVYSTDLYEPATIALFARYYHHILSAVLKNGSIRIEDLKLEGFMENMMLD